MSAPSCPARQWKSTPGRRRQRARGEEYHRAVEGDHHRPALYGCAALRLLCVWQGAHAAAMAIIFVKLFDHATMINVVEFISLTKFMPTQSFFLNSRAMNNARHLLLSKTASLKED